MAIGQKGWLRVASDEFLDKSKFPNVPVLAPGAEKPLHWDFVSWAQTNGEQKFGNSIGNSQFGENKDCPFIDAFYFYQQEKTVYFTETDKDSVVIAALQVATLKDSAATGIPGCFEVSDKKDTWALCETKDAEADLWICALKTALGQKCDTTEGVAIEKVTHVVQPVMIVPLPAPNCETDWNYDSHGDDWVCRCNEGLEQSPIDLPWGSSLELLKFNAEFDYVSVPKDRIKVHYETNMLKIEFRDDVEIKEEERRFGTLHDVDGTVYAATEIRIHTPGEHKIAGKQYEMEIQIIHESIEGNFKN